MKKYSAWAILLALSIVFFTNIVMAQPSAHHPLPSGLLFSTYYNHSDNGLFYVDPDTMEMAPILDYSIDRAFWSPDGTQIAFVESAQRVCIYQFDTANRQCANLEVPLWDQGRVFYFPIAWNSNGDSIFLLLETPNGLPQLGIIDVSGIEITPSHVLPLDGEIPEWIYWSPTGEYLAYQTFPGQRVDATRYEPAHLKLLNIQTGEMRHITDQSYAGCVTWAADGERIGVVSEEWEDPEFGVRRNGMITIYDLDGDILDEVQPRYQEQNVSGCRFAWSNDGNRLAFFGYEETRYGGRKWQLFVAEIDNGATRKLLTPSYSYHPDTIEWSFDDTHLVVGARYADAADIRVISLDGWERVYTLDGIGLFYPSWRPPTN